MARRTKEAAEQTRQRILRVALDLFSAKGYERTTVEAVARRIRLSKGAVYWHFKSKPHLLAELAVYMSNLQDERVLRMLPEPVSLHDLTAYFVERARLIVDTAEYRKFFRLMQNLDWRSKKFAPLKMLLRQTETGVVSVIKSNLTRLQRTGEVRPDADIVNAAVVLGALWLGLLKIRCDRCCDLDLSKAIGFGFGTVIDSMRVRYRAHTSARSNTEG